MATQAEIEAAAKAGYEEVRKDHPGWMPWEHLSTDSPTSVRHAWIRFAKAALEAAERAKATRIAVIEHEIAAKEAATIKRFAPLLAKIAAISLWRDTYPDGPDVTVYTMNCPCPYGLTADDVRLARTIVKPFR